MPWKTLVIAVVEAARVALGEVHLDAVVGALGDVVVVDVDGGADLRVVGVDAVGEVVDAVVADDVAAAGQVHAARVLDALGARPLARAFDEVVGDEEVAHLARLVPVEADAVHARRDVAAADDHVVRVVGGDAHGDAADGEPLEPHVVDEPRLDAEAAAGPARR